MDLAEVRKRLNSRRGGQRQAARAAEVSPQHLSGFLAARDSMSVTKLTLLAQHLRKEHKLKVDVETLALAFSAAQQRVEARQ